MASRSRQSSGEPWRAPCGAAAEMAFSRPRGVDGVWDTVRVDGISNTVHPLGALYSSDRACVVQIKKVSSSSSSSDLTLTDPASAPGPRAPPPAMPMPLELLAGSELRRCPAPLLYLRLLAALFPGRREELRRRLHRRRAGAEHRCLAWSLQLPRRKANSGG